jgi:hypothetical protein
MFAAGIHGGYAASQPRLHSGSVWLASIQVGQLTLLDGSSAEVSAQVRVAPQGDHLDVVQDGPTAFAVNNTAGSIRRIDGATFETSPPASPLPDARDGLRAFAGPDALYAMDSRRGVLADTDPKTLASRGTPVPLATRVSPEATAIDGAGRLWVLDITTGDLVWIVQHRQRVRRGAARPGAGLLTIAGGVPVIIDTTRRTATTVDPDTGAARRTVDLDLRNDDHVQVTGSADAGRVYVVAARGVLVICDLTVAGCSGAVPLGVATSNLGAAVESGGRLFVPDYGTGRVWIVDLRGTQVIAQPQVLTPGTRFQLLTRDGIVFFNDPNSERAGVIRPDGEPVLVSKYDPSNPGRGLTGARAGGDGKPPAAKPPPAQPNSPDQPSPGRSSPPPKAPAPPVPQPGDPPPGDPQPGPSPTGPPPSTEPPPPPPAAQVRIAVSNGAPLVGDDIVLEAQSDTGQPTSATWTFGDGGTATGVLVTHSWSAARTYQIGVRATFPGNQVATASQAIRVTARPVLTVTPPANGRVTGSGGIDCPGTCSATFNPNGQATLTANPDGGFVFLGWGGSCGGRGTCTLTMNGDKNVTASFGAPHTLSVQAPGGGTISGGGINCPGTCSVTVDPGTRITLRATPAAGNGFLGWGGDCSGTGTCAVTMNADHSVSGRFDRLPTVTVDVSARGHVTGDINCPASSTCGPIAFPFNRTIRLRAVPDSGTLVGWDGNCTGSGLTCQFNTGTVPGAGNLVLVNFPPPGVGVRAPAPGWPGQQPALPARRPPTRTGRPARRRRRRVSWSWRA